MKPQDIARERARWRYVGDARPPFATPPGPGQQSVWDFPRPPRLEAVAQRIRVEFGGHVVAESTTGQRICETAGPPVYYFPPADVRDAFLKREPGTTHCEWKGVAHYYSLAVEGRVAERAIWTYPDPDPDYAPIRGWLAFHAGRVDACFVGDARVTPQPGAYYGGWITPELVGPFKGAPGSEGW